MFNPPPLPLSASSSSSSSSLVLAPRERLAMRSNSVPPSLRERFPDEMTIVLQNKFWDLKVEEDHFSVGLSFNQIPADLVIPYAAITQFVDPAVDFGLQFQATVEDMEPTETEDPENDGAEQGDGPSVTESEDGSNVVTVDFGRKK